MHMRKQIRAQVKAMLLGKGPWLTRVTTNKFRPEMQRPNPVMRNDKLPSLNLYTLEEQATEVGTAPREYSCELDLVVEIMVSATSEADDAMDDIAEAIEVILGRDDSLGGLVEDCLYVGMKMAIIESGEMPIGGMALTFRVNYRRFAPDEGYNETLPWLDSIDTHYNPGGKVETPDQARTLIEGLHDE